MKYSDFHFRISKQRKRTKYLRQYLIKSKYQQHKLLKSMRKEFICNLLCFCLLFNFGACTTYQNIDNYLVDKKIYNTPTHTDPVVEKIHSCKWKLSKLGSYPSLLFDPKHTPYLQIHNDGRFSGYSGCNSFFGKYTLKENLINFGSITSSASYCTETASLENIVLNTFRDIDNYSIEDNKLLLKNGGFILMYFIAD